MQIAVKTHGLLTASDELAEEKRFTDQSSAEIEDVIYKLKPYSVFFSSSLKLKEINESIQDNRRLIQKLKNGVDDILSTYVRYEARIDDEIEEAFQQRNTVSKRIDLSKINTLMESILKG